MVKEEKKLLSPKAGSPKHGAGGPGMKSHAERSLAKLKADAQL
jgi:hypothetical protein